MAFAAILFGILAFAWRAMTLTVLASRGAQRDHLVLPNRKNPSQPVKRVYLPAGQAISRVQARTILKDAPERADVRVLALRASLHGAVGEPAPAHPHLFRHARVRQIVRTTRNLPLAQRQAGWSRLQMLYLTLGDEEARRLIHEVPE